MHVSNPQCLKPMLHRFKFLRNLVFAHTVAVLGPIISTANYAYYTVLGAFKGKL